MPGSILWIRICCSLVLAAVLADGSPGLAQETNSLRGVPVGKEDGAPPTVPPDLQHALDLASGISAEVYARTLLRASNHRRVSSPEFAGIRREWIERAFHLATQAKFPFRLEATDTQSTAMRSVEGMQALALAQNLDTLSLQTQAVESLLRIDPRAAVELFSLIPLPRSQLASCRQFLVPNTAIYYRPVGILLRQRQRLTEREAESLKMTVRDAVSSTDSVSELAGLIPLVASPVWSDSEWEDLRELAAAAITRIPGSDRTPWRHYEVVQRAILSMPLEGSGALLRDAWAGLLERQANAVGCEEELSEEQLLAERNRLKLMKDAVSEGIRVPGGADNQTQRWVISQAQSNPTDGYEVRPIFVDETPRALFLDNPSVAANLRIAALPRQPEGPPSPGDAGRLTQELRENADADFVRFVTDFHAFRAAADIHSEVRFHEICQLWLLAIRAAPSKKQLLEELQSFSNYLAETPMRRVDPPSWIRYSQQVLSHWNSEIGSRNLSGESVPFAPPATLSVLNAIPISPTDPHRPAESQKTKGPERGPAHD